MKKQEQAALRFSQDELKWAGEIAGRIEGKLSGTAGRCGDSIIYTLDKAGRAEDMFKVRSSSWVNGFWPGILWLLYIMSKDPEYAKKAKRLEKKLDQALYLTNEGFEGLHHDVGFMWVPVSVASYRLTGDRDSRRRALIAADYLAARWNPEAGFLTAWNQKEREFWSIIDTMMNLSLLYWASEETGYDRFSRIASLHAKKAAHNSVRPDASVNHIVRYDSQGNLAEAFAGQGSGIGSCWSRGEACAVYGFTVSYLHTGNPLFLDTARKTANYFLAALQSDEYVPLCDFRAPREPVLYDSTAGAIAASGMLTLASLLPEHEGRLYSDGALRILKALESKCCDFSDGTDLFLGLGAERYDSMEQKYIIYGDYYYLEAVLKILGVPFLVW